MRIMYHIGLVGLSSTAFAGSFVVINNQGRCMIWSNHSFGCTGYSIPFAHLEGDDCSSKQYPLCSRTVLTAPRLYLRRQTHYKDHTRPWHMWDREVDRASEWTNLFSKWASGSEMLSW